MRAGKRFLADRSILLIAEGFGIGRLPAPGTFGSLLGFVWIALLLLSRNVWIYCAGIVVGFFVAVWIGDRAEKILGKQDPGSVVIDEIAALPLAFLGAVIAFASGEFSTPGFGFYLRWEYGAVPVVTFVAFRIFDILKPFGIARAERFGAGYGLVLDDFLAAAAACPLVWLACKLHAAPVQ